jgi:hypothetical protein
MIRTKLPYPALEVSGHIASGTCHDVVTVDDPQRLRIDKVATVN